MRRRFTGFGDLQGLARLVLALASCIQSHPAAGADAIAKAGNAVQIALPVTALGLTIGRLDGKGALQFGESAALTIGITELLKYTVPETRPNGGSHSFPSGHTSISFMSAEFMRKRYGWEYGLPSYLAAGFVGYSRVEANEHHPRDVVAGAAIGVGSSFLFTTHYQRHLEIEPEPGKKHTGIRISYTF
jgi:membrane-associated phospholipid phosphatase